MARVFVTYLLFSFVGIACRSMTVDDVVGTWEAYEVMQEGDTLNLDLEHVVLKVNEGGEFLYTHSSRDTMSGNLSIDKGLIHLEVAHPSAEILLIQLQDLDSESMTLRMNHDGKERIVSLSRR